MFEYLTLISKPSGLFNDKKQIIFGNKKYKEDEFIFLFNHLGNERWNLIGMTDFQNITRFYFKRKVFPLK